MTFEKSTLLLLRAMEIKLTRDEPGDLLSTVRASRATPPFVVSKLHQ